MPRDVFISATRGRAFWWTDQNGNTYRPMAAREDVSESLDFISDHQGAMMYRSGKLWVPVPPPSATAVLGWSVSQGKPIWSEQGSHWQSSVPLFNPFTAAATIPVDSTAYVGSVLRRFRWDTGWLRPTHFRVSLRGQSTQAGQTVTVQLTREAISPQPVHVGGDDLVVANTRQPYDSDWRTWDDDELGFLTIGIYFKGSNSTVDITLDYLEILLKGEVGDVE